MVLEVVLVKPHNMHIKAQAWWKYSNSQTEIWGGKEEENFTVKHPCETT